MAIRYLLRFRKSHTRMSGDLTLQNEYRNHNGPVRSRSIDYSTSGQQTSWTVEGKQLYVSGTSVMFNSKNGTRLSETRAYLRLYL